MFSPVALIVFLFPLAYSPGPGNMFFAANGAALGFRATIPANVGYHFATWLATFAIGAGLHSSLDRYPTAFAVLKVAGAAYIMLIAWRLFRSRTIGSDAEPATSTFADGAMLLVLNPKAYLIIALMFTQFLDPTDQHQYFTVAAIATIFTINNLLSFTLWAAAGDRLVSIFRSEESAHRVNRALGIALVIVSVWILVT